MAVITPSKPYQTLFKAGSKMDDNKSAARKMGNFSEIAIFATFVRIDNELCDK
jgi:hypothetical protein